MTSSGPSRHLSSSLLRLTEHRAPGAQLRPSLPLTVQLALEFPPSLPWSSAGSQVLSTRSHAAMGEKALQEAGRGLPGPGEEPSRAPMQPDPEKTGRPHSPVTCKSQDGPAAILGLSPIPRKRCLRPCRSPSPAGVEVRRKPMKNMTAVHSSTWPFFPSGRATQARYFAEA